MAWWEELQEEFVINFVEKDRWKYLTSGLGRTLEITLFAVLVGIVLGLLVGVVCATYEKTGKLKIGNALCRVYLTVVRGTPMVVQLMILYFLVFLPLGIPKMTTAILAFGINSGAYVAEIIRSGIMAVDPGQMEAGRSLGFSYTRTMWYVVMPQAVKNVLPALGNEFIVLMKETSVCSFIGLNDLMRGGDIIRGVTYSDFMPLIAVALIYLVMVMILSYFVRLLERRLRGNER